MKNQQTGAAIAAEGLMVYDGSHHYRAVNQEVRISFRSMQHPGPEVLKTNMEQTLTASQTVPERFPVSLNEDDVSKLHSRPEDIPEGAELSGARDAYVIAGQPIAYGGMSTIYLARRNKDSKICVLKVMPLVLNTQPALVKRFTREGRLAQTLENDHIVKILDSGYSHSQYFLVMEYIEGGSLADELWRRSAQSPPFSLDETLTLIRQIATGLQRVHRKNMVHRDLKPSNIMLETRRDSDESVQVIAKVTDFGLVRRVGDQSAALTATLDQLGTFEYMAPEQFHGKNAEIDHRADIYAIGKILCVMLSGKIPNNIREVEGIDFGTFLPSDEDTKNNEGIKQVIQRCMAENPDDRFQNIEDFLEALELLNELDTASSFLKEAGITFPEVKVAFSMASIGQTDAQKKIMQLVTTSSDEEIHYQASLASSQLPHGMDEIVKLQRPSSYRKMNLSERTNLNKALFHIVRFRESSQPKLGGEPWVRALNPNVRRRLFLNLIRSSVWEQRTKLWEYVLFYGGMAAIAGGITGVLCSLFEASMFWRISAPGTPYWSKVVLSVTGPIKMS
ncbi:MAG: serine/threonine-protein kinase [Thermodesulfobacteriota bacterium]|nr:serine/threonine-protein kinase [Thermodesulfobacteriota bacterium]